MHPAIEAHRADLTRLCKEFHVQRLELIGSALREDFDPARSDFDFLVTFHPLPLGKYADAYFGFKDALEQLLGRPVDLVMPKGIENPYFLKAIEQNRATLYAA